MHTENTDLKASSTEALGSDAMARRRVLLKGIGTGSAVLAAALPIQTLASQSVLTPGGQHQCTISGAQSGVHSATTTSAVCGGYSVIHWGSGNGHPTNSWPTDYLQKCAAVFTKTSLPSDLSLFQVMKDHPTTNDAHWICAWLNALWNELHPGTLNFPYTGSQVLAFYGSDSTSGSPALNFFMTYMEGNP